MSIESNKQVIRDFFAALSNGNSIRLRELMHSDIAWTLIGNTPLSKTYRGHAGVEQGLLAAVGKVIDTRAGVGLAIIEMIGEGDKVVCRAQGTVTGKHGPYNNTYCHVFTVREGQIVEDIEYLDTLLIERALYGRKFVDE